MSDTSRPAPAPRRRFGAGALIAVLVVGLAAGGAASWLLQRRGGGHDHGTEKAEAKDKYTCPMHPTIVSDHPGDCPICGMALVPIAGTGAADDSELRDLTRRLWVGTALSVPLVILAQRRRSFVSGSPSHQ